MLSYWASASATGFQQIQKRHRCRRENDGERFSLAFRQFGIGGASGKAWGSVGRAGGVTWLGAGATGEAATPCARAGSIAPATKYVHMSVPQKARRLRRIWTVLTGTGLRNWHFITITHGATGHRSGAGALSAEHPPIAWTAKALSFFKNLNLDHAWGLPAPPRLIISMAVFSTAAVRFLRRFAFGRSR